MNMLLMIITAVMVGLTTLGALTWAYLAEDRAYRPREQRATERDRDHVST